MTPKESAKHLASYGRHGDTTLLHVSPQELAGIASLTGQKFTTNPETGLPEAFLFLPLIATALGSTLGWGALGTGLAAGLAGTLESGDINKGIISGITGGLGSSLLSGLGSSGAGEGIASLFGGGAGEAAASTALAEVPGATMASMAPTNFATNAATNGMTDTLWQQATQQPMTSMGSDLWEQAVRGPASSMTTQPASSSFVDSFMKNKALLPLGLMATSFMGQPEYEPPAPRRKSTMVAPFDYGNRSVVDIDPYKNAYESEQSQFRTFAQGGVASLTGGDMRRDPIAMLRSYYGNRQQAVADMANPRSLIREIGITDPNSPILDKAFGSARLVNGPGDGLSDSIPAMIDGQQPAALTDGEVVIPSDVVSHIGNGSTQAGAKRLMEMAGRVRQEKTGSKKQPRPLNMQSVNV